MAPPCTFCDHPESDHYEVDCEERCAQCSPGFCFGYTDEDPPYGQAEYAEKAALRRKGKRW